MFGDCDDDNDDGVDHGHQDGVVNGGDDDDDDDGALKNNYQTLVSVQ